MSSQKGIKIYWNMNTIPNCEGKERFIKNNCWYGDIIIKSDGYFEGIVELDRKDENSTKQLVFGIINDNINVIYKINNEKDSVHIYRFQDGEFIAIYGNNEFLYGECKIELEEKNNKSSDNLFKEIKSFKEKSESEDLDFYKEKSKDVKSMILIPKYE